MKNEILKYLFTKTHKKVGTLLKPKTYSTFFYFKKEMTRNEFLSKYWSWEIQRYMIIVDRTYYIVANKKYAFEKKNPCSTYN